MCVIWLHITGSIISLPLFADNKCGDCPLVKVGTISVVVGFIICLALVGGLMFILYKRGIVSK